jgi:hypothetical protein
VKVQEFRDDDAGYMNWATEHSGGHVINIQRTLNFGDARVHRAVCPSISGNHSRAGPWTGAYIKVCADELSDLDAWALAHGLGTIRRCAICFPAPVTPPRGKSSSSQSAPTIPRTAVTPVVRGPLPGRPTVEAWATGYIQFERRSASQDHLRSDLRARVQQLRAKQDQVLHATFFGPKPERADIENLTLYNIDETGAAFSEPARFGLRFECGLRRIRTVGTVEHERSVRGEAYGGFGDAE